MKPKLAYRAYLVAILVASITVSSFGQSIPSAERLRTHVTYLASDALEGRRTGTPGAQAAAQYVAGEFSRWGLKPGMQSTRAPRTRGEALSRYLQKFPYVASIGLGKNNVMSFSLAESLAPVPLRVGEDWMPLGPSANALLEDKVVVFAGYGITASDLNHNDYASASARDQIAIVLSGTPDGNNPHGQFARFEELSWKAIAARNAGAKGLIVIASEESFKNDRLARLRYDHRAGDAGIPVVVVSRQAATRIMGLNDIKELRNIENAIRHQVAGRKSPTSYPGLQRSSVTIQTDVERQEVAASNVVGILQGSDPELRNEAIVIGAHYDHLGRGGEGSLAPKSGAIHHGADDNASGVAGLLELARLLSSQRPKPRRTIVFIAFGGEEQGLLGSNYYVNHPAFPLASTVTMLNMDMIGRMKENQLVIGGVGTAAEWRSVIEAANVLKPANVVAAGSAGDRLPLVAATADRTVAGTDLKTQLRLTLSEDGYGPSDHSSFYAKQIPVLFFWTGTHEDYHKPSDTAEKINYEGQVRILGLSTRIIRSIDANDQRPVYTVARTAAPGRATGFNVYLGTIPNYADTGEGLLLDAVREDSPAAQAGLKAEDRIVKLAGREIRNVYDYTFVLGELKAGQTYEVEVLRGSDRLSLKITPAARR